MASMMASWLEAYSRSPDTSNAPRVLCVGTCALDIVQTVEIFPEEDTDKRCIDSQRQRGGNASNNCTVLAQMGVPCEFLGTFSKDDHYDFFLKDFNKYNICTEKCVLHSNCNAPLSTVILSLETGSRTIIHSNNSLPELKFDDFKKVDLKNYSWIHFEGRNASEVQSMMEYIEYWNSNNKNDTTKQIKISLDVEKGKEELIDLLPYADVLFVGKDFAKFKECTNMSETLKVVSRYTKDGAIIICAWGDRGAMAKDSDGTVVQSPAYPPKKIIDTLGAGDTFCAAVIYSLLQGKLLQKSISLGCQVAGGKIAERGFAGIGEIHKNIFSNANN